jgi:4-amino-4-deoxy-L-arabinose transferase-like glycosyltransferase
LEAVVLAGWRAALTGAIVAAVATLPGLGAGTLWDNSETAYGEVAREVLLSHDPIVLHLNGDPWFVQPPLYFWIAAAFGHLFGVSAWAFRLPSALATIVLSGAVGYVVARLAGARAALLAAIVLSTSLMTAVVGRLAIMDALLDLAVAIAILGWFGALRRGGAVWWYAGWGSAGLGFLAKGPVAVVVPVLVVGAWVLWDRAAGRRLEAPPAQRWLLGIVLFAVIVLPWAFALWHAVGASAFRELIGHYTIGRYVGTIENQAGPVWYYVPVVVLGFFPWFAFLIPAMVDAFRMARMPEGSLERLALVWAIVPFVFFSFAQTKLPNYIALEFPAFAILVALWFERVFELDWRANALRWAALVPLTILGVAFAIWLFSRNNQLTPDLQAIAGGLAWLGVAVFAGSLLCFVLLTQKRLARLGPFALGATTLGVILFIALVGEPIVESFKPIPKIAATIDRERRPDDVVAIQGVSGAYALLFYTRPRIETLDEPNDPSRDQGDAARAICAAPRAFVVTSRKRPTPDPTYGRERRVLETDREDVLYLYEGPCAKGVDP